MNSDIYNKTFFDNNGRLILKIIIGARMRKGRLTTPAEHAAHMRRRKACAYKKYKILLLRYKYGFSMKKIAQKVNRDYSRVRQILCQFERYPFQGYRINFYKINITREL